MSYREIAFGPTDWKHFDYVEESLYNELKGQVFTLCSEDVLNLERYAYHDWLTAWRSVYTVIGQQAAVQKALEHQHYVTKYAKLANTMLNARIFFKEGFKREFAE